MIKGEPRRVEDAINLLAEFDAGLYGSVFSISRDWSRSEIKSCNPKNQIWDNPEIKWYLSQSGCGIKSGINTTFLARNCGSVSVAPELTMPPRRTGFNEYMPQGQRTLTEVDGKEWARPLGGL